jgi:hypothetical protein
MALPFLPDFFKKIDGPGIPGETVVATGAADQVAVSPQRAGSGAPLKIRGKILPA